MKSQYSTLLKSIVLLFILHNACFAEETDLEKAFLKEFTFLEAQKHNLNLRINKLRSDYQSRRADIQKQIQKLEKSLADLENKVENKSDQLKNLNKNNEQLINEKNLLKSTIEQAKATLNDKGIDTATIIIEEDNFKEKMTKIFANANKLINERSKIRKINDAFFLKDGKKTTGELLLIGDIAAFGFSPQGSGVLSPAGDGNMTIWRNFSDSESKSFASSNWPETIPLFLYESKNSAIEQSTEQSILEIINSGGIIAWVIVLLGIFALVLIVVRYRFLSSANHSIDKIDREVSELVKLGKISDALDACQRTKGSISKVLTSTLRHIDKERTHLEDIISEVILSESIHLNRYGAAIIVIAAISPLLGLLGTVTGMIATFHVITEFGTGDPKLLSGGISTALVTTQVGLVVAIPALIAGNLMSGWSNTIKDNMEKAALHIINSYEINYLSKAA